MHEWKKIEPDLMRAMRDVCRNHPDPSHDFSHVERVVKLAKWIALSEGAELNVVVPAAYLHDFEFIAKTDPRRARASGLSAEKAVAYLKQLSYPENLLSGIFHAIEAHSFSAGIPPTTLEAKVVQEADRLDGIGAIGIMRCFGLSGLMKRDFYRSEDPFCKNRAPDDQSNSLDHFYTKLLKVPGLLHTASARLEGAKRAEFMRLFLARFADEII